MEARADKNKIGGFVWKNVGRTDIKSTWFCKVVANSPMLIQTCAAHGSCLVKDFEEELPLIDNPGDCIQN